MTEMKALVDNGTFTAVPRSSLPKGTTVIGSKYVFKIKIDENGKEERLKARMVPKGYMQKYGVDYFEIFAPTLKYTTLRILLSLVALWDYDLFMVDVSNAFLNAEVKEDVYVELPDGFKADHSGDYVLKLNKALYGIHQAPREWYLLVTKFLVEVLGFTQCVCDPCLFFKRSRSNHIMLLAMFVDDYQAGVAKEDKAEWIELKLKFMKRFKSSDKGETKLMLGMRITRDRTNRTINLDQEVYTTKKIEEFNMENSKPVSTPGVKGADLNEEGDTNPEEEVDNNKPVNGKMYMKLVGALLYASLSTRLDITHSVHQLTMHTQSPQQIHWIAGKRVLRYLQGTKDIGLQFGGRNNGTPINYNDSMVITGYADADYANDTKDRKSITGWIVKLNGDVVNWQSKKQSTVALSTCEAELYAEASCVQEVMWLQHLLGELGLKVEPQSVIWGDNQSTLELSENGIIREKTKHVAVKYHFICEKIKSKLIKVKYIQSAGQQADILTKGLDKLSFEKHRKNLMLR
jgi:hypothetical protein